MFKLDEEVIGSKGPMTNKIGTVVRIVDEDWVVVRWGKTAD